jgi:glycosyltransferase involved in cell wall biosynthesis
MRLSVIVCTWNRRDLLKAALDSIAASELPPTINWEILIADNNSTDGTRPLCEELVRSNPTRFRYFLESRPGKSFALNTAVENSQGEILAFTDDDVKVAPNWLAEILHTIDTWRCAGVAGKIVPVWAMLKPHWLASNGPYRPMAVIVNYNLGETARETTVPPFGANVAFTRQAFAQHGLYRTDIGPSTDRKVGCEDTEFGRRVLAGGGKIVYAPRAVVYHPVEEARLHKNYFRDWYFDYGQAITRAYGVHPQFPKLLGAPRYLYRKLATSALHWLLSANSQRRFYYNLQLHQLAGELKESRRQTRRGGSSNGKRPKPASETDPPAVRPRI